MRSEVAKRPPSREVGRNDRQDIHDHPFWAGIGLEESLGEFQTLGDFTLVLLGIGVFHFLLQLGDKSFQINVFKHFLDGVGSHSCLECVVTVFVFITAEFILSEDLSLFQGRVQRINDDVIFVVDDAFQMACRHVQHQADAAGHALVEPNVGDGDGQFNVSHAFTADSGVGNFYAATVADDTLVLDSLVLAAGAFHIARRSENAFAEQAAFFWLERTVIDCLWIGNLTEGPGADGVGIGNGDGYLIERLGLVVISMEFPDGRGFRHI